MPITRARYLLPVVLAASVLTACGSDSAGTNAGSPPSGSDEANAFVLDEWSVVAPSGAVRAGKVAVTATNKGTETHEFVIVRATGPSALPLNADGSVNEDEIPEPRKAGEIEDLAAGKTATKTLDLPAGDYVVFCNIVEDGVMGRGSGGMGSGGMGSGGMGANAGMGTGANGAMAHVHFKLGMVTTLTVT